jgi:hypothetical protein
MERHAACVAGTVDSRSSSAAVRTLPGGVVLAALAVVGLNLFDALSTLAHVDRGAVELNPLMRELLAQGPLAFVLAKHFLVGAGVILFAAHCRLRLALGALRLVALPAYAMVALYQATLFALVS